MPTNQIYVKYSELDYYFPKWSSGKESASNARMWVQPLGQEDPLEKETATHSSILAWEIPCIENLSGYIHSMGLQKSLTALSN